MSECVVFFLMLGALLLAIPCIAFYENHRVVPANWPQEVQCMLVSGVTVSELRCTSGCGWTDTGGIVAYVRVQTLYGTFFVPSIQDYGPGVKMCLTLQRSQAPRPLQYLDKREFISPMQAERDNGQ